MILKNTDNDYIIEIRNIQTIDGTENVIEERLRGKYRRKGAKRYIIYDTPCEDGVITFSLIVSDENVTIRRSGAAWSVLVLDARGKTTASYGTPYGAWRIDAETEKIISALGDEGGELRLKYILTIQGGKYCNDMIIKVIGDKR